MTLHTNLNSDAISDVQILMGETHCHKYILLLEKKHDLLQRSTGRSRIFDSHKCLSFAPFPEDALVFVNEVEVQPRYENRIIKLN